MAVAVAAAAVEEEAAMETAGAAQGNPSVGIGKRVCWSWGAVSWRGNEAAPFI